MCSSVIFLVLAVFKKILFFLGLVKENSLFFFSITLYIKWMPESSVHELISEIRCCISSLICGRGPS